MHISVFRRAILSRVRSFWWTARVQPGRGAKMVTDAYVQILKDGESASAPGILPVYVLSGALTQQNVRTAVKTALAMAEDYLPESLPQEIIDAKKLPPRFEAVKNIHFPVSFAELARARSRFIFEELFLLQVRAFVLPQQG